MDGFEEEGHCVLKKQRLCADRMHQQLDLVLAEVESAKAQLIEKRDESTRKRNRSQLVPNDDGCEDEEMEKIVQDFVERVKRLNLDKSVAEELKGLHVALAKYGKQIDKHCSIDVVKICRSKEPNHRAVVQLIAEYLYHDGQIAAADALCKEADVALPTRYRLCFVELHAMVTALKEKNMEPALTWSRQHQEELKLLHIDIEFELVQLKYIHVLEECSEIMDVVHFAGTELSPYHPTHTKAIGRLLSCALFKGRLADSPYADLVHPQRWEHIQDAVHRACCRLRRVPYRPYLTTCLSAGETAMPAMRKLVTVLESKLVDWTNVEELPVEIPIEDHFRFHTVFTCPVSKEEGTPSNPPMLLKCGHVICKSCVKKISFNMTRRFKCPTCPMDQSESETRELYF